MPYRHLRGGGFQAGEEGFAHQRHLFDDAAGPGYGNFGYGDFALDRVFAAELGADQQDKVDEIRCGFGEDFAGDCIAGFS